MPADLPPIRFATSSGPVTREQLIDLCWPGETDMTRLSARLSVQLSTVRRMLVIDSLTSLDEAQEAERSAMPGTRQSPHWTTERA